jgi:protein KRI1
MSSDEEEVLTINKEYARKYEERKKAEELSKLRERYGDIPLEDEESSSSSELEDEEAMGVTDRNELDFLRTLSLLKSKSQDIYQKDTHFFESEGESSDEESAAEVEEKPLYLKDYERQRLLERGERALVSDSEDEEADPNHSKVRCCLLCGV